MGRISVEKLTNIMEKIPLILKMVLNLFLLLLVIFLIILIGKETYHLGYMVVTENYTTEFYKEFLKGLLTFFLYLEFVLMIIKYFEEDYHFPLRYFMYIGITATIRLIIVDHDSPKDTVLYALVILLLVIGYGIITYISHIKNKQN